MLNLTPATGRQSDSMFIVHHSYTHFCSAMFMRKEKNHSQTISPSIIVSFRFAIPAEANSGAMIKPTVKQKHSQTCKRSIIMEWNR